MNGSMKLVFALTFLISLQLLMDWVVKKDELMPLVKKEYRF
jgi:hypothetical protein